MNKLFALLIASSLLMISCGESKTDSEEKEKIEIMDSTEREVKKTSKELEEQTEKVEKTLEKLEEEFKDTTN